MRSQNCRFIALLLLLFATTSVAQRLTIKPYYGYLLPRMGDVNNRIDVQLEGWRDLLGEPLPAPGEINGNRSLGGQLQYHLSDEYFLALNVSNYQEKIAMEYFRPGSQPADRFFFEREVESIDVVLSVHYYFAYDESRRLNPYVGIGAGLLFAKAKSNTISTIISNPSQGTLFPPTDTRGDFSGETLIAAISGGLDLRIVHFLFLWGELGYQIANLGQLEGSVTAINEQPNAAFTTRTSFDFSGLYFRGGLGIRLPL